MSSIPIRIVSLGKAVPKTVITNDDLTKILDTSDEWITTRTGIKQRHIASGDENSLTIGIEAAREALGKANLKGEDIDLIIAATSNPFNIYPSTACSIQEAIEGKSGTVAFDITAACTGMIYAMEIARSMISSGKYNRALLVATDTVSKFVNWEDRSSCVLFGDGASAMILEKSPDGVDDIIAIDIHADGRQGSHITMHLNGTNCPLVEPAQGANERVIMNGREVYKFVVTTMPESVNSCIESCGLTPEDIDYLVPHQANLRIIDALQQRLNYTDEKVITNIDKYGNTSAASVGIALSEAIEEGKIKTPSTAILCAFGAGMTWGSVIVKLRKGIY